MTELAIKENLFEKLQTEGVLVKAEKTITIEEFNHNSKEWIIDRLACMSADDALQNISNLYDELHRPKFPKSYEECCKVLNIIPNNKLVFSNPNEESEYAYSNLALYNAFNKLKICRDAYWIIAGDWKPNREDDTNKYLIINSKNHIVLVVGRHSSMKLSFPTEEIRDVFYKNFKELIEKCKELL